MYIKNYNKTRVRFFTFIFCYNQLSVFGAAEENFWSCENKHGLLMMALMLSQSIPSPKTYQNMFQGCAYAGYIYDLQVKLWT